MVATPDEVLYSGSSGYAQVPDYPGPDSWKDGLKDAPLVTDESIFELWSCTKLVSVLAALQLIEQGRLDIKAEASKYVPRLKDVKIITGFDAEDKPILVEPKNPVTVEMLICHTSGFTDENHPFHRKFRDDNELPPLYWKGSDTPSLTEIPLIHEPGSTWRYGFSNDWLALCVESVSGQELDQYFKDHIFKPLGITDMTFRLPQPNRISLAHVPDPPTDPFTFTSGTEVTQEHSFGGAGLFGSPRSYLTLLRAVLNHGSLDGSQILKPSTVATMFEPHLDATQAAAMKVIRHGRSEPFTRKMNIDDYEGPQWGYGGALGQTDLPSGRKKGSLAWSGYATTFWIIDPNANIAFVIWTHILPNGAQQFFDLWEKVEPLIYQGLPK
ncbi:beta-lactamase/transpeptidase-like protein [Meredithblackwellia eburnea MCA 4105]